MLFSNYLIFIFVCASFVFCDKDWSKDQFPEKWNTYAKNKIDQLLNRKINGKVAKNIVLFMGDGMGISTVTAGRIRKGQLKNNNGEEEITFMETLDNLALSKTADSAGTATAYLSGVKTRIGAIGVDGRAVDCPTSLTSKLESILKWAHFAGKSTGIVTTTRVTHATPAGAYAYSFFRELETYDGIYFKDEHAKQGCKDIAAQLVDENTFINVIFGGGRRKFMRTNDSDIFALNKTGDRIDGRNLIDYWQNKMKASNLKHKYLWNLTDFNDLKPNQYDHILGLLNWDHMDFSTERSNKVPLEEPSISEMTEKAIELLSANPNGYFLFVEGGKIDHAHHASNAQRALDDFVAFDDAIGKALNKVSLEDTTFVVTADHSHVFTIGGYASRGNSLFGVIESKEGGLTKLKTTYTALSYGNGPGYNTTHIRRTNLTSSQTEDINYIQESAAPLGSETHGGEDVAIYASGPMAFLFDGTVEQNYIAHVMAYSACIGPYNSTNFPSCKTNRGALVEKEIGKPISSLSTSGLKINLNILLFFISLMIVLKRYSD